MTNIRLVRRIAVAIVSTASGLACLQATPSQGAGYTLRVAFDGGYVFDFGQPQSIDVFALKDASLPLKAEIERTKIPRIDLQGAVLTFEPEGKAPAPMKPGIPPKGDRPTTCDRDADTRQPNNMYFIPSLPDVAARMKTTIKPSAERYGSIHLTGGGAVSVATLGGCVEYRDGAQIEQRSIASGIRGIVYQWPHVPGTFLQLRIQPTAGGPATLYKTSPDQDGNITLHVTSFLPPPSDGGHVHDLADFWKHFGPIFNSTATPGRFSLSWARAYDRSPGIDCPPGSTGS
jgi:hypothetical protein